MGNSPVKKLNFEPADKENVPVSRPVDASDVKEKPVAEKPAQSEPPKVAPTIKECEAHEPLLQENPHRFVLFPIKYHEVSTRLTRRIGSVRSGPKHTLTERASTDLADVQEGRGVLLDCGRDRSVQRPA